MSRPISSTAVDPLPIADIIRTGTARGASPEALAAEIAALFDDPIWAKAMSHPLRGRILRLLRSEGSCSPVRASRELDSASLGTIAYHFRKLEQLGLIQTIERVPRRGAVEHVFGLVD